MLLSHNGMDVDLKLASRVSGIDIILGGHTHDAVPQPVSVANAVGSTLVSNAGSNGKFVAVIDLDLKKGASGSALPAASRVQRPVEGRPGDERLDRAGPSAARRDAR